MDSLEKLGGVITGTMYIGPSATYILTHGQFNEEAICMC